MISRLIILVFLSITIQTIVAQDLEQVVIPAKVKTKEAPIATPIKTDVPEPTESIDDSLDENNLASDKVAIMDESTIENIVRDPDTYRKEEYLNKLLRQTYYQRLTTTQWSKYLNPIGWKKSVQKWRYWNQLKNYITGNDHDILVIRTPSEQPNNPTTLENEPLASINTNQVGKEKVASALIEEIENDSASIDATPLTASISPDQNNIIEAAENMEEVNSDSDSEKEAITEITLTAVSTAPWLKEIVEDTSVDTLQSELVLVEETIEKVENTNVDISGTEAEDVPSTSSTEMSDSQATKDEPIETIPTENLNEVVVKTRTSIINEEPSTPVVSNKIEESATSYVTGVAAKDFHLLQGRVPWPVNGRITDRFGIRKNAEARGLKRENYGIDMICPTGTIVKAVHKGTVIMSRRQSPYDYIVTIKHGDYSTAYYYLITPYVNQGDEVQSGQAIGQLRTSVEEADFHFEIWNNTDRVNPEVWLSPK